MVVVGCVVDGCVPMLGSEGVGGGGGKDSAPLAVLVVPKLGSEGTGGGAGKDSSAPVIA